jgi:hypothetical protein
LSVLLCSWMAIARRAGAGAAGAEASIEWGFARTARIS